MGSLNIHRTRNGAKPTEAVSSHICAIIVHSRIEFAKYLPYRLSLQEQALNRIECAKRFVGDHQKFNIRDPQRAI